MSRAKQVLGQNTKSRALLLLREFFVVVARRVFSVQHDVVIDLLLPLQAGLQIVGSKLGFHKRR